MRNSAPVEIPWLIIWSTAPLTARGEKVKRPNMTKPMCETDE